MKKPNTYSQDTLTLKKIGHETPERAARFWKLRNFYQKGSMTFTPNEIIFEGKKSTFSIRKIIDMSGTRVSGSKLFYLRLSFINEKNAVQVGFFLGLAKTIWGVDKRTAELIETISNWQKENETRNILTTIGENEKLCKLCDSEMVWVQESKGYYCNTCRKFQ